MVVESVWAFVRLCFAKRLRARIWDEGDFSPTGSTGADDSHPHVNLIVAPGGGCIRVLLLDSASSDRGRLAAQRDNGASEPRANRAPKIALACFSVGDKLMRTILSDMSVKRPCRAII
jgi:hypothetical protein